MKSTFHNKNSANSFTFILMRFNETNSEMVYSLWMLYLFACMILQAAKIEELFFSLQILGGRHESLKELTQEGQCGKHVSLSPVLAKECVNLYDGSAQKHRLLCSLKRPAKNSFELIHSIKSVTLFNLILSVRNKIHYFLLSFFQIHYKLMALTLSLKSDPRYTVVH